MGFWVFFMVLCGGSWMLGLVLSGRARVNLRRRIESSKVSTYRRESEKKDKKAEFHMMYARRSR